MPERNNWGRFFHLNDSLIALHTNRIDSETVVHTHRSWTLGIVLKGERKIVLKNTLISVKEKQYYIIPPNCPHKAIKGLNQTEALIFSLKEKEPENSIIEKIIRSNYSRRHKIRIFKEKFGLPPARLFRQKKVLIATELLSRGYSQAQAAVEAGFFDQSHFCHCFRSWWGWTPNEFAKTIRHLDKKIIFSPCEMETI